VGAVCYTSAGRVAGQFQISMHTIRIHRAAKSHNYAKTEAAAPTCLHVKIVCVENLDEVYSTAETDGPTGAT